MLTPFAKLQLWRKVGGDAIQLATLLMMFEGACKIAALQKSEAVVHRFSVN